jgi:uncharacterized protein YcnI
VKRARSVVTALAVAVLAVALPEVAQAHVEILPGAVTLREEVELTIRVPNERPVPFTSVRITFPRQVSVADLAPPPAGWTMKVLKTQDRRNRGVLYSGGSVGPGEYQDFELLAAPLQTGQAVWPVLQTYADGKVKPWTGAPERAGQPEPAETGPTAPGPAPAIDVRAPGAATTTPAPSTPVATRTESSDAGVWLGIVAIVLALGSALLTGLMWSTRPAKLPEDDDET